MVFSSVGVVQCIDIAMFTGGHHTARITEVALITPDISQKESVKEMIRDPLHQRTTEKCVNFSTISQSIISRLTQQKVVLLVQAPPYRKRCNLSVSAITDSAVLCKRNSEVPLKV